MEKPVEDDKHYDHRSALQIVPTSSLTARYASGRVMPAAVINPEVGCWLSRFTRLALDPRLRVSVL